MPRTLRPLVVIGYCALLAGSPMVGFAQAVADTTPAEDATSGSLKHEIDDLNAQVKEKEQRVKELDATIAKYKTRIQAQESALSSLENEVALLENRIQEKQLGVERTKEQIALTNLEIQALSGQIQLDETRLVQRREGLAELIRQINEAESVGMVESFLARPTLSELDARIQEFSRLEEELGQATQALHESKDHLESQKRDLESQRQSLQDQRALLVKEQGALELDRSAKVSLVSETQNKEGEFQRILYELRQQQQSEASDAAALEAKLKDKLDAIDETLARGDVLLSWPIKAGKGVSARFHDPGYPFRKLFEHPGIDLPTDVGTPVHAAAGGYVAWNRTGKQYGNYVMIVHAGGIATVYAHLSRFGVKPDTYVERGDVIGYSGGRPGDQGAGLSTGPHLHFEVRQDGIPVNPEQFLPSLD